jgi:Transposase IS116/IS110/IS902 family
MIEAMIAGVRNPRQLAALASAQIKATPKQLYDALHGRLTDHHRFLLKLHLRQWDGLDATIREIDLEVEARIARMDKEVKAGEAPFRDLIGLVCTIPGVSTLSGTTILSEIGRDMSRFPTAGHLVAWAGLCPGQNESAGKRKSVRLRKGAPWLKTMLVHAHGRPSGRTTAITRLSSSGCKPGADRRKPFVPSPPPSSRRSTTSSETAPNTTTSGPTTSIAVLPRPKPSAWLPSSPDLASKSNFNAPPRPHDAVASVSS